MTQSPQPAPPRPAYPSTAEIPVIPPLPSPRGTATAPPTKELGTPVPPTSGRRFSSGPRARASLVGVGLVAVAVLLLGVGLSLDFGDESFWSALPLWSTFASVAALLGLLAFVPDAPGRGRLRPRTGWRIGVCGLIGLALFWLLVVLPVADSDRGFLLTAAVGCLGAALWIAPSRRS